MDAPSRAETLIAEHGGRVTRTRVAVLEVLLAADRSLSHDEIAAALTAQGIRHDRVTLYRTLDWLVDAGVAHRMTGGDERTRRFGVAATAPHEHAHFHCDRCGKVVCLEGLAPAVAVNLPGGYELDRAELVLHGACPTCGKTS
ncbi:transcriptional repressor [Nitrogeniibacter mangrovi]|uniref:Ferric uptake regulation protein n=1 Tax=Nitrogeniibacter mangrovi TaxID=2016596 RepID=A0A6C1B1R7_9RHOO|nr:Fur family transcriptional regulator [Nitrogeniibacter mangrovi]QID16290.1 transcriptional repressor [Nitrogeniibacter mangrovi]